MEMLVVLAITAILLLVLFVPLSKSIELVKRGTGKVTGQDSVRRSLRRVTRDLMNAMEVYEPRPIFVWGFANWQYLDRRFEPVVGQNASQPYLVPNGVFAFRLPRHRYYCVTQNHFVTPLEVADPSIALDTCPRHLGEPVEFRPNMPLEPDDRITAYFVGLKDPSRRDGQGNPLYDNMLLFNNSQNPNLNTYILYRVEFHPDDPNLRNWDEDLNRNGVLDSGEDMNGDGRLGPNARFFYDTRLAPNGQPFWQNWLSITVTITNPEVSDVVRWLETAGKLVPHPLVGFNPAAIDDEEAGPNRSEGQFLLGGGVLPAPLPPVEHLARFGHWTGLQHDATRPVPDTLLMGSTSQAGVTRGVRIQVIDRTANPPLVFDTLEPDPARRRRLLTYDSLTGRVVMGIRRWNYAGDPMTRESFSAPISATYSANLSGDVQVDPNGMPSSFGAATSGGFAPRLAATTRLAPGSEEIQLVQRTGGGPWMAEPMRRVGWTGLGSGFDRYVAQADLQRNDYTIDYRTGEITLADRDPLLWQGVGPGGDRQLLVKYRFQTNNPTDIVRVSYITKELTLVNLGVMQYTRKRHEVLPFEVSERVEMRNLRR